MSDAISAPDTTIVTTRIFPVPRGTLYAAFADPAVLARWWGPNGFTNTVEEFDLRPGGTWRVTMHGPDGANYQNVSTFDAVVPGECVAFTHHEPHHVFRMDIQYADDPAGCRLTWRMTFADPAHLAAIRTFLEAANEQNFDRLAAAVA